MSGAPEARRSCDDCARWLYKENGEVLTRGHERVPEPRPPSIPTPCATCPKVPPDAPVRSRVYAQELSGRNLLAYQHYLRCKAVGHFPDDPLVARNAAIISSVLADAEDRRVRSFLSLLERKE